MKVHRLVSLILCLAIILCIVLPQSPVNAASVANLDNVITAGDYVVYTYQNPNFIFSIFLNCQSGVGSFAIINSNDSDYIDEYLFSLEPKDIETASESFWSNLISDCFAHAVQWRTTYLPDAITQTLTTENTATTLSSDPHADYFMNWLINLNGPPRTDSLIGHYMEVYVLFSVYETVRYNVSRCNSYIIENALTAAGFVTEFLGAGIGSPLVALIGQLIGASGELLPDTVVGQYTFNCTHDKYVTTRGGNIKYARATHYFEYDGYTAESPSRQVVDEDSLWEIYDESEEQFDTFTLLETAFAEYTS